MTIEAKFKEIFGDMYLSESETASRIFEYGYKAGAAAENEACAELCVENMHLTTGLHHAAAIRERMKND